MSRKDFEELINEILKPLGFKKKASWWRKEEAEVTKLVNLQKSQFSNLYYINYGVIINALPITTSMHVFNGLGSVNLNESMRIKELLDFENKVNTEVRKAELIFYIEKKVLSFFQETNTVDDIKNYIISKAVINRTPKSVLNYLKIDFEGADS